VFNLQEILFELEKKTSLSKEKLMDKIKEKQDEFSGLVSADGAAHLVARDFGIDILKTQDRNIKIKDVTSGMRNLNLKVRILDMTPVKEFNKKDGSIGRVSNLIVSDGTGEVRIPLWDKQVEMVNSVINIGDVIEIKNVNSRDNIYGGVELVLFKFSSIDKIEDDKSIPFKTSKKTYNRILIKEAKDGFYEIKGTIVDIFNTNPLFLTCPKCKIKVEDRESEYFCQEHGIVVPDPNIIITGVLDDGTSSIRGVFFRDTAKLISNLDPLSLIKLPQKEITDLIKNSVLGEEFIFKGKIRKNKIFDTLEMAVNDVETIDFEEESKKLIDKIESLKWL